MPSAHLSSAAEHRDRYLCYIGPPADASIQSHQACRVPGEAQLTRAGHIHPPDHYSTQIKLLLIANRLQAFFEALKSVVWVMMLVAMVLYISAVLAQGFFAGYTTPYCPSGNRDDCIDSWFSTARSYSYLLFVIRIVIAVVRL